MGTDCGDAFQVSIDSPRKVIVSNEVTSDKSGSDYDATHNTPIQFISFGLPSLKAEYFRVDSFTADLENSKLSLDDPQEGEENHEDQNEGELNNSVSSVSYKWFSIKNKIDERIISKQLKIKKANSSFAPMHLDNKLLSGSDA